MTLRIDREIISGLQEHIAVADKLNFLKTVGTNDLSSIPAMHLFSSALIEGIQLVSDRELFDSFYKNYVLLLGGTRGDFSLDTDVPSRLVGMQNLLIKNHELIDKEPTSRMQVWGAYQKARKMTRSALMEIPNEDMLLANQKELHLHAMVFKGNENNGLSAAAYGNVPGLYAFNNFRRGMVDYFDYNARPRDYNEPISYNTFYGNKSGAPHGVTATSIDSAFMEGYEGSEIHVFAQAVPGEVTETSIKYKVHVTLKLADLNVITSVFYLDIKDKMTQRPSFTMTRPYQGLPGPDYSRKITVRLREQYLNHEQFSHPLLPLSTNTFVYMVQEDAVILGTDALIPDVIMNDVGKSVLTLLGYTPEREMDAAITFEEEEQLVRLYFDSLEQLPVGKYEYWFEEYSPYKEEIVIFKTTLPGMTIPVTVLFNTEDRTLKCHITDAYGFQDGITLTTRSKYYVLRDVILKRNAMYEAQALK